MPLLLIMWFCHPGPLCNISWYLELWSFIIIFLAPPPQFCFNPVWRICSCLFVFICLHSAILTLCLLTFAFCLPAHLSSMLSSYLSSCLFLTLIYFLDLYHPIINLHVHTHTFLKTTPLLYLGCTSTQVSCDSQLCCLCVRTGVYPLLINPFYPIQNPPGVVVS